MAAINENNMKNICIGLLAHVDAGKTTLTETLLFNSGAIRKAGRVDHRDTFLDTDVIERERGITVFSKLARMTVRGKIYTLLDTPGHADLSPEMERTLWILDYAVLIISAADKVTSHDKLLWGLLERSGIPVFIFVNKMDSPGADKADVLESIQKELSDSCVDFTYDIKSEEFREAAALTDEELLEKVLAGEGIDAGDIKNAVKERKIFPVYFGSALKNEGVSELTEGLSEYMSENSYPEKFGAKIFKISRDAKGNRLAWMKITGGTLSVKQNITYIKNNEEITEKADQIRIYSGEGFEPAQTVMSGDICAVAGLGKISAGDVLGIEKQQPSEVIEPVLTYELDHDEEHDAPTVLKCLRIIEEEEPKLHVRLSEKTGRISVRVMGSVQMDVVKRQLKDRFGISAQFGKSTIIYKETVAKAVVGVGHFEPLRHYTEVRVLIEPLERNSGLQIGNLCQREELEPHWQKLILSYLEERTHTGVLTDSELTDVRISLLGGKAHTKHTGGGDFREAVYRAVRQGLMESVSVLLEPVFDFTLCLPEAYLGKALFDLDQMGAEFEAPIIENGEGTITGKGPVSKLGDYQSSLTVYTSGQGRISVSFAGYEPCHNADEVISETGYDPDSDTDNPSFSVFCSHGAGVIVPWYQVKERMHTSNNELKDEWSDDAGDKESGISAAQLKRKDEPDENLSFKERSERIAASEKELQDIFSKTYGSKGESAARPGWKKARRAAAEFAAGTKTVKKKIKEAGEKYLLVDGYNIIFAWDDLKAMSQKDIGAARDSLMDILSDYQGMTGGTLILVFDAYKVSGGKEAVMKYHNIYVVYTRESETADQYIEKTVHEIGRNNQVTVATSDGLEQMIILGEGAARMSAAGLLEDIERSKKELRQEYLNGGVQGRNYLSDNITADIRNALYGLEDESKM
jgi:ribosomal protection tetracycline resistance protein